MSFPPQPEYWRLGGLEQHQSYLKQGFVVLRGDESCRTFHALGLVPGDVSRKERAVFSHRLVRGDHYLPRHENRSGSFALYFHAFRLESGAATHTS